MLVRQSLLFAALSTAVAALPVADSQQQVKKDLHPVKQLWQGAKGTWLENLAVRSNGNILATRLDVPQVYEWSAPDYSTAHLVANVPGYLGVTGIAETAPDVFAFITGNFSLQTVTSTRGSYAVWTLDFRKSKEQGYGSNSGPSVKKIASLPTVGTGNGLAFLPGANSVLVADSNPGDVYRVGLSDGAVELAISNALFKADPAEGLNGIKVANVSSDGTEGKGKQQQLTLFFDNSNTGVVGSLPIDPKTGKAAGQARVIGTVDQSIFPPANTFKDYNDDLLLSRDKRSLYVAGAISNTILQFDIASGAQKIIAGNLNSTEVAEPTAVALGRRDVDRNVLYVVGGGGQGSPINGSVIVGAQLLAIDLSRKA